MEVHRRLHIRTIPLECVELYQIVAACEKIPGDMAEAGVFRGGTAALMLEASQKRVHLFDTFQGLPQEEGDLEVGEYAASLSTVQRNLSPWTDRIEFHPGLFPASAAGLEDLRFSFVHLDLDLYEGTLAAIQWFFPRIHPGGILLSHDFPHLSGVVQAFEEFFKERPEVVIALSGQQCLVVKQ